MNNDSTFTNRIAQDPDNTALYLDYAIYLRKAGRDEEARQAYQRAIVLDPEIGRLTLPEIESKMRYEIGSLNNNFETYFQDIKHELYNLYEQLNYNADQLNIIRKNVYQLNSVNPLINFEEVSNEPAIICVGGSAFKILDDYFNSFVGVNLTDMKEIAPRTNDIDMMICVSEITEASKQNLVNLIFRFINAFSLSSMEGLLPFTNDVVVPDVETIVGISNNNLFQVTTISRRTYFNVRININVPGKGVTHLFEIVLWVNDRKSECRTFNPLKIIDNINPTKFVIIPTVPDLIENTNRVIYKRGKYSYGKCRQDYLRAKWLYLNMEKLFSEGVVNDSHQQIFGSNAFFNKIHAQLAKISDDLKHCNTDYFSINETLDELQSEYNLFIDQKLQENYYNRETVNNMFTGKMQPFANEEENQYSRKYKKYKKKYITLKKLKKINSLQF